MKFKITIYDENKNYNYIIETENYERAYNYCLLCGYNNFLVEKILDNQ